MLWWLNEQNGYTAKTGPCPNVDSLTGIDCRPDEKCLVMLTVNMRLSGVVLQSVVSGLSENFKGVVLPAVHSMVELAHTNEGQRHSLSAP